MTAEAIRELQWPERGESYRDPVGGAVVLVLASTDRTGVLRCNGVAMIRSRPLPCSYRSARTTATELRPGLRYRDAVSCLEVALPARWLQSPDLLPPVASRGLDNYPLHG